MVDNENIKAVIRLPEDEAKAVNVDENEILGVESEKQKVRIKVQRDGIKHPTCFRISPTDTVDVLLQGYCKKFGLDPDSVTFKFDGDMMDRNKSLEQYDIDDDDYVIDAIVKH